MQFTVTFNGNGGSGGTGSMTVTYGQKPGNISSKPSRTGYTYAGHKIGSTLYWNSSGTAQCNYGYTSNQTAYAQWNVINYTISYSKSNCGISGDSRTSYNIETATFTLGDVSGDVSYQTYGNSRGANMYSFSCSVSGGSNRSGRTINKGCTGNISWSGWRNKCYWGVIKSITKNTMVAASKAMLGCGDYACYNMLNSDNNMAANRWAGGKRVRVSFNHKVYDGWNPPSGVTVYNRA